MKVFTIEIQTAVSDGGVRKMLPVRVAVTLADDATHKDATDRLASVLQALLDAGG